MSSLVPIDVSPHRREAALRFLYDRIDYERALSVPYRGREFKLDRMRQLLARLGNPQEGLPIVHVAGTKGKGSTVAVIGAVLSAAGCRTGIFTSPHLDRVEQRMAIDGRACSSSELVELIDRLVPVVEAMDKEAQACDPAENGPTYFEIITAMALLHFAQHKVDAAVLEVGLGGRLDSTNVCHPLVSVITSISFDHTRQLGDTLEAIAREKAGIIKPGVPVVSGVIREEPRAAIREVCNRQGCRLLELGVDFDFRYHPPRRLELADSFGRLDFRNHADGRGLHWDDLSFALLGHHQAANATVALATLVELERIGWRVPEEAIRAALAEINWPARVELVARRPAIIIDSAHNLASVDALLSVLDESFFARRRLLVFATTREKDALGILGRLLEQFDEIIFTRYLNNPRAVPPGELAAVAAELDGRRHRVCPTPLDAWDQVGRMASPEDLICVTGSFYIAAEMREQIQARPLSLSASAR